MSAARSRRGLNLKFVIAVAVAYALLAGFAQLEADTLMFQPSYGSHRAPSIGAETIAGPDGVTLSACFLPNAKSRFVIWYFHGNAEDLGDVEPRLQQLHDLGYSVFAYDYPGYGLSGGTPSEKSIYAGTKLALAHLARGRGVAPEQIIVYGRSIGSGPAVDLAANEHVAGLVIESGLMSAFRVMTHWRLLPFDKFENLKKMPRVRCPVLVIHGRDDHVIPFYHGEALYAAARTSKQFFWSQSGGHNDLRRWDGPAIEEAERKFFASVTVPEKSTPAAP